MRQGAHPSLRGAEKKSFGAQPPRRAVHRLRARVDYATRQPVIESFFVYRRFDLKSPLCISPPLLFHRAQFGNRCGCQRATPTLLSRFRAEWPNPSNRVSTSILFIYAILRFAQLPKKEFLRNAYATALDPSEGRKRSEQRMIKSIRAKEIRKHAYRNTVQIPETRSTRRFLATLAPKFLYAPQLSNFATPAHCPPLRPLTPARVYVRTRKLAAATLPLRGIHSSNSYSLYVSVTRTFSYSLRWPEKSTATVPVCLESNLIARLNIQ